jgi:hypothetical protein
MAEAMPFHNHAGIMRGLKSNLRPFFPALEELSLVRQVLRLARLDGQGRLSAGDPW